MKKHLEENHRLPLAILLLLIIATFLASFYAGSKTAGVFVTHPRAFFEGPFMGIGIGDLLGILQPGVPSNNPVIRSSNLVRQCLVCNTNGYCERDLFTNQASTCNYYSDSLQDKISCNQVCANNQLAAEGKAAGYLNALGGDSWSQCDGKQTQASYHCTQYGPTLFRYKCDVYSTHWIDLDPPCDANKFACNDTAQCIPKQQVSCDSENITSCFDGKLFICKASQWVPDPVGCLYGKVCNSVTGTCEDTLCAYDSATNGISCQDIGQRKMREVICSSDGKSLTKNDCGPDEDCVAGTGCVPMAESSRTCTVNQCTTDRTGYWECDSAGTHHFANEKRSCNGPYCIQQDAKTNATCDTSDKGDTCDKVAVDNNERRCSPTSKNPQVCIGSGTSGNTTYQWQDTGEDCASYNPKRTCVAGACVASSTAPTQQCTQPPPLSTGCTCEGKTWMCLTNTADDCTKAGAVAPKTGCTCNNTSKQWSCPTTSTDAPAECSDQCKDKVVKGTTCGCNGNTKLHPLYYTDCSVQIGNETIQCKGKLAGCDSAEDPLCIEAEKEDRKEQEKGQKGDKCGGKDDQGNPDPPCAGGLFCNWQDSGYSGAGKCDDREAETDKCTPNPSDPSADCGSGYICRGGDCVASGSGDGQPGDACEHQGDCADNRPCENGKCTDRDLPDNEQSCEERGGSCVSGCGQCEHTYGGECHGSGGCTAGICCT